MTPEQEAEFLIQLFKDRAKDQIFKDWDYYHKACAIICVDEIIALDVFYSPHNTPKGLNYWEEVKQALLK